MTADLSAMPAQDFADRQGDLDSEARAAAAAGGLSGEALHQAEQAVAEVARRHHLCPGRQGESRTAALYDALNCASLAVLCAEGEPDADRSRLAQDALWQALVAADSAFPDGGREYDALLIVLGKVSAVLRDGAPA